MSDLNKKLQAAGWMDFGGDICWETYGGSWGIRAGDGTYYVIRFDNMAEWGDGASGYHCEVLWIDLPHIAAEQRLSALRSLGLTPQGESLAYDSGGDLIAPEDVERVTAEALFRHGSYGVLWQESSPNHAVRLRSRGFEEATSLIVPTKEAVRKLRALKAKPANKIGTSVAEMARGDVLAGLRKYREAGFQPQDQTKDLMFQIMGNQL